MTDSINKYHFRMKDDDSILGYNNPLIICQSQHTYMNSSYITITSQHKKPLPLYNTPGVDHFHHHHHHHVTGLRLIIQKLRVQNYHFSTRVDDDRVIFITFQTFFPLSLLDSLFIQLLGWINIYKNFHHQHHYQLHHKR